MLGALEAAVSVADVAIEENGNECKGCTNYDRPFNTVATPKGHQKVCQSLKARLTQPHESRNTADQYQGCEGDKNADDRHEKAQAKGD